ncbi:disulfide bond formation protein B [Bacteriovorax sp. Seq25_V]|uniref:disulfide bond formation protein B n=1 Tax=Bacteriovorax sp. Seq25_V TaxID=1201288 RepID=UPI000389DBCD|nr:disulfide bond formation protein B [Bacteriovorax sp. Seq25_V]EQC46916.1 disulfide bond formation protein C [Bacteriovorax sp. Seq25_V]
MNWYLIFFSWLVATIATLGSLFFSEIMGFPPCVLCWYQRICMYPLSLIFLVGLFPLKKDVFRFTAPLVFTGWVIAIYHNLLYYKILPESAAPCSQGISCTTSYISWFGFITIPFLSLIAFSAIGVLIITFYRNYHEKR